jgi:cell division protein FtsB
MNNTEQGDSFEGIRNVNYDGSMCERVEKLEQDVEKIKDDVAVLKDDVAVLKDDVAVLKDDVAVLKDDVGVLKTDVAVLKTDVAVLKTDVAVLKTDVAVLKDDVTVLKADVAVIKSNYVTHGDLHAALHAMTWRIFCAMGVLCAAVFWIARNVAPPVHPVVAAPSVAKSAPLGPMPQQKQAGA